MTSPDEAVLDDAETLAAGDPAGMLPAIALGGAQVREAQALAREAGLERLREEGRPRAVVVAGLGTSGLAGDVLAALAGPTCPVPVLVWRRWGLPKWVGAADVVVTVSRSGRSEESLVATDEGLRRGARVVTVGAPGSPLASRAEQGRALHVAVSPRRPARASFWGLSVPVLMVGHELGLLEVNGADLEATAQRLADVAETCRPGADSFVNPAKALALTLSGQVPVIWGTTEVTELAARRFADQLASTGKHPAMSGALPEVSRSQVAVLDGWFGSGRPGADPGDIFRDRVDSDDEVGLHLVLLRDVPQAEHPSAAHRAAAVEQLARSRGIGVTVLQAEGESTVERLASLVGVIDFAATYVALATGVDPSAMAVVEELKAAVAR